jgi:hypothetical protein
VVTDVDADPPEEINSGNKQHHAGPTEEPGQESQYCQSVDDRDRYHIPPSDLSAGAVRAVESLRVGNRSGDRRGRGQLPSICRFAIHHCSIEKTALIHFSANPTNPVDDYSHSTNIINRPVANI